MIALSPGALLASAPSVSPGFEGIGSGFSGPTGTFTVSSLPPMPIGAVGPDYYVQVVNSSYAVFDKTGKVLYGPVPTKTLWSGFGGGCETNNDGVATVLYDSIEDRWVIAQPSYGTPFTPPYLYCVAVSQTPDPRGAYYRYSFSYGTDLPDSPRLALWPDAYYVTFNMYANAATYSGPKACALDRKKMLLGMSPTQQCFNLGSSIGFLLPGDVDGKSLPLGAAPNPMIALGANANELAYYAFHVDWAAPANSTLTGPTTLTTDPYTDACSATGTCIPQAGTMQKLDSNAARLMNRLAYRNFGDHESLVTSHAVVAGTSSGVRWYELRLASGVPSIYQQGTYAPDSNYRWMSTAATDQAGNMALGFSLSGASLYPSIHITGRLASDPTGTMTLGEGTLIDGTGSQTGYSRWGDYTSMRTDPLDDCTFWYTNQYLTVTGNFNWHTRIGSFKLSGCPPPPKISVTDPVPPSDDRLVTFGSVTTGLTSAATVTVTNVGAANLVLGTVAATDPLAAPYSITADGCSGQTVAPANSCAITVTYAPVVAGASSDSFSVPSNDGATPVVTINVNGTGLAAAPPPAPRISVMDSITPGSDLALPFGSITTGSTSTATVTITNIGGADLVLGTVAATDPLAAPYSITADTCSGQTVAPANSCAITVTYAPVVAGASSDSFSVPSNDGSTPSVTINVSGTGSAAAVVNSPPGAPILISPSNSQTGLGATVEFTWNKSTDPDGDAITYHLYVCTDQAFAGCTPADVASSPGKVLHYAGLGMYGSLLTVCMVLGGSRRRRQRLFLVMAFALLITGGLISCGGGSSSGGTSLSNSGSSNTVSYSRPALDPSTTYYWKVVADDGKAGIAASDVWSFTTQ